MKQGQWVRKSLARLGLVTSFAAIAFTTAAADTLTWRKDKNSVDADVSSWDLLRVLENVAEATGWNIYLEPGTKRSVSAKFKNRTPDKALDLMLGNLGRVLLPGTNGGPARLLVFRTSEKDATQLIRAVTKKKAKPIPNELIVTMKPGAKMDDLAKKLGAKIKGRSGGLNAYRLEFDNEDAANAARAALADNDDVSSIDVNYPVQPQPVPEGTRGDGSFNFSLKPLKDGDPIIIGLIDTPVQKLGNNLDEFLLPSISVAGDFQPSADHPTHGTAMSETMLKNIAEALADNSGSRIRILPVDVYGANGTTTTFEVAAGIYEAMKAGASIINLSLGSDGDTPLLHNLIKEGYEGGRLFVGAAGNEPVTTPTFPAAYPEVIAVTAADPSGQIASYANRGAFVDAIGPGTYVIRYNGQAWMISGTSAAAAGFSGMLGGTAEATGQSPAAASRKLLYQNGTK